jgi:hypothetical protein
MFSFLFPLLNTASTATPQIPLVSMDAVIEPRTVATLGLTGGWGGGVKILKDARHRIGLLQYNLSTGY